MNNLVNGLAGFVFLSLISPSLQASSLNLGSSETYPYFFSINEKQEPEPFRFLGPQEILAEVVQASFDTELELLKWLKHQQPTQLPPEKYNRTQHFGRWVNDPTDTTCYNTRANILIRDSLVPVSFKSTNPCVVEKGEWADPYSGKTYTLAKDIQIDHFVPLKNAYMNGAHRWSATTRCMYANFQSNEFHLLSVNGGENMSKGDGAPDRYIPSNDTYICDYLENWLKTKLIWRLTLVPPEAEAIRQLINQYHCSPENFILDESELAEQRTAIANATKGCQRRAPAAETH